MDPTYALRVALAAAAVHNGTLAPNKIQSQCSLPRSTVENVVKSLPSGLGRDDDNSLKVLRAVCSTTGAVLEGDKLYTLHELRGGLLQVATGLMKTPAVKEEYGVPESTMKKFQEDLREVLGYDSNKAMRDAATTPEGLKKITAACQSFSPAKRGRESFLSPNEMSLFKELAHVKGEAGYGQSRRAMKKDFVKVVHAKGEEMKKWAKSDAEKSHADRMSSATLGGSWLFDNLKKPEVTTAVASAGGGGPGAQSGRASGASRRRRSWNRSEQWPAPR